MNAWKTIYSHQNGNVITNVGYYQYESEMEHLTEIIPADEA